MAEPQKPDIDLVEKPLTNRRYELFASQIARGKRLLEAYGAAGFKVAGAESKSNAQRVLNRPEVQGRIAWFQYEAAKLTVYDAAWIKDRLARHAEHLTEVVEVEEEVEVPAKGKRKAFKEIRVVKKPGPLWNPSAGNRALELLGKEHGLFKEKIELGGTVQVANAELARRLTPEERQQMRTMLLGAMQRTPDPANENQGDPEQDGGEAAAS